MKKKMAVIADDLTGCADTGVQFVKKGLKTYIVSDIEGYMKKKDVMVFDTLVVDTESRFDEADIALAKVESASSHLKKQGVSYLYKKTDSTFRGNIGSEIEGAMKGFGINTCILAGAFPKADRTITNGNVFVEGKPLHETEFGRDERNPVSISSVKEILGLQTEIQCVYIPLNAIRAGENSLANCIEGIINGKAKILIADAETDDDLKIIANASAKFKDRLLFSGSAGFAEQLPEVLGLCGSQKMLIVAGSVMETTRKQIDAVKRTCSVREFNPRIDSVLGGIYDEDLEIKNLMEYFEEAPEDIWIIRSARTLDDVEKAYDLGYENGMDHYDIGETISLFLGRCVEELIRTQPVELLFITGGDTAYKVFNRLSAEGILIMGEVINGIPWGIVEKDGGGIIKIMTKGGGIGTSEDIVDLIDSWRGRMDV